MVTAALTAKIKSKMALDDLGRHVRSTTHDEPRRELRGTVGSVAEHDRAVQLAKETAE